MTAPTTAKKSTGKTTAQDATGAAAATVAGPSGTSGTSGSAAPVAASGTSSPARRTRRGIPFAGVVLPLLVFGAVIAAWYAVSYLLLDESRRFLMPPPHEVITDGLLGASAPEMWQGLMQTTTVALTGLAIAAVVGITWAIVMSQSKRAEAALFPYAVFLQCIPVLALVPLVGFWFGFGFSARVFV
ncbi:MAG: ABC transporter permease, partial [Corynebacterium sp.]